MVTKNREVGRACPYVSEKFTIWWMRNFDALFVPKIYRFRNIAKKGTKSTSVTAIVYIW